MIKTGFSASYLAAHLDISSQRVGQLRKDGVFQIAAGGKFDLDACRIAYIRWLRSDDRRSSRIVAASRIQDARAAEIEQRTAARERQGEAAAVEAALAMVDAVIGPMRSEVQAVPPRVTKDIRLRQTLERELNIVLDAAANRAAAYRKTSQERRASPRRGSSRRETR